MSTEETLRDVIALCEAYKEQKKKQNPLNSAQRGWVIRRGSFLHFLLDEMDSGHRTVNSELLWDGHSDEDLGDLLDLIMKNALPSSEYMNGESSFEEYHHRTSDSASTFTQESFSLDDVEWMPQQSAASLLRRVQATVDLRPGFSCVADGDSSATLSEIIRRQLIMDEVRAKLDASTVRVYARRHGRNASIRRDSGPSLFVPRRRGVEMPPSFLALIEKMNPVLFEEIHDGVVDQLPVPPDDIS
ncbi:unnamed protein product [Nippostrongylus brasiliensis]|uniref:DUF4378 domain-containing protein n=1 Tax=Nippostrongylus brasiliensis TaxID=27835 RepID=A0A0N4YJL0_NIPBR|nr:unnamed protein product [Nippostrongylus brasiliensis]